MDESHYVDAQLAIGCKRLFAAIIGRAVYDACLQPTMDRETKKHRPTSIARDAIEFLFLPSDAFDTYMEFLDIDVGNFRSNILDVMSGRKKTAPFLDKIETLNKRNFNFNYRWTITASEITKSAKSCEFLTTKQTENTAQTAADGCPKTAA